ncbi:hypothetical protein HDC92_004775 [Pedobacter sp. AK017]|uniref:hypothetical protein n=1 Tax=Pedobacter sp. AK017 TaxID=2723073 RepID=UPI001612433E|nr:hypothetical protein [Pedobacter sp. AK017]MBB5441070.1 hypothetical protein [Pedobacter sp. AK017]
MKNKKIRKEKLFASVSYPDGKMLKVYQVISADELKKLAKMVEQDKFAFSNIAQAISVN